MCLAQGVGRPCSTAGEAQTYNPLTEMVVLHWKLENFHGDLYCAHPQWKTWLLWSGKKVGEFHLIREILKKKK